LTWWYELGQFPTWDNRIDVFDNTHILLRDTPSVDDRNGLTVYVSLVPTECVDSIPRSIATPFGRGIAQKAIADALRIPNKPWTSAGLSRTYELDYYRAVLSARNLG